MKVSKEIWLCASEQIEFGLDFAPVSLTWYAEQGDFDNEFEISYREDNSASDIRFSGTPGTYTANFTVWQDVPNVGESIDYQVIVHVLSDDECSELYDNCCDGINIQWLNQVGGMQNYYFNGVKTFEVSQENAKRYIDYNKIARYSDRGNVYNGMIVSTKAVPQSHVDLLDSLRYSIQAYENRDDVLYPILIDPESYTKYKSKDKKFDVYLKFIYADPVKIQTN